MSTTLLGTNSNRAAIVAQQTSVRDQRAAAELAGLRSYVAQLEAERDALRALPGMNRIAERIPVAIPPAIVTAPATAPVATTPATAPRTATQALRAPAAPIGPQRIMAGQGAPRANVPTLGQGQQAPIGQEVQVPNGNRVLLMPALPRRAGPANGIPEGATAPAAPAPTQSPPLRTTSGAPVELSAAAKAAGDVDLDEAARRFSLLELDLDLGPSGATK